MALLLGFLSSSAQEISGIEWESIIEVTRDEEGPYYWPDLVDRFIQLDESITESDLLMLYYGFATSNRYDPYDDRDTEEEIIQHNQKKRYGAAISLADQLLTENPVSIQAWMEKAFAFSRLGKQDKKQECITRYSQLLGIMFASGKGDSPQNPYFVLSEGDIHAAMEAMGVLAAHLTELDEPEDHIRKLEVLGEDGIDRILYFSLEIPYRWSGQR